MRNDRTVRVAGAVASRFALPLGAVCWLAAIPAAASGVVGTGTPASCTESALSAALASGGLVTFNCGPSPHTIVVASAYSVVTSTTVDGGGRITLSGGNTTRVFMVLAGNAVLRLQALTLTRGVAFGSGPSGNGGCLWNQGRLELQGVTVTGCRAENDGGGIYNESNGVLEITGSVIQNNTANRDCGGVCSYGPRLAVVGSTVADNQALAHAGGMGSVGYMEVRASTIRGNVATRNGGGLFNNDILSLIGVELKGNTAGGCGGGLFNDDGAQALVNMSTITGNNLTGKFFCSSGSANSSGGGIATRGPLVAISTTIAGNSSPMVGGGLAVEAGGAWVSNSTLSGNVASIGGAVWVNGLGALELTHVTVAEQAAWTGSVGGSGIYVANGSARFSNVILAVSSATNCGGARPTSAGTNISSDASCRLTGSGDRNTTAPLLGPLGLHGGPTLSYALLANSPAIDAGVCASAVGTDQRGLPRPQGAGCDIGAYEVAQYDLSVSMTAPPGPHSPGAAIPFAITVSNQGPPAHDVSFKDTLPPGLDIVSISSSQGACGTRFGACVLGTIAGGATVTVQVVAVASSPGRYTNTAAAAGLDLDIVPGNDTSSLTVDVATPPPPPPPPTGLSVALNASTFRRGETMIVTALLTPITPAAAVDAYIVLQTPTGALLSLQLSGALVPGIVPIARNFVPFAYQGPLVDYSFGQGEPPGTYTWYSVLTQPGTLTFASVLQQQVFTLQ